MAGIQTAIQLQDRMTPVLQSITASMNIMLNSFSAAQAASSTAMDTAAFQAAQREIGSASAALGQYQEELERVKNAPVPTPQAPTWQSAATPAVYMSSGADRFEAELQSANQMAQQLYQSQQRISAQAKNISIVPPGMINDVDMVSSRISLLANRVQELNQTPRGLRTEQTNNEVEALRGKLSQALGVQENLNAAMSHMDISAANVAYRQLNAIVDSTERDIRSNIAAQDQFNQSLSNGNASAGGLENSIKRYAGMLLSVATAGKALSLADEVTQTNARLDLMNQRFGETENLQQRIYASAQQSRGAYQTTADAVAKLGMQAGGAFANTNEIISFTEQLNKTFAIAGTSAQGIDSVMLQLTQSMAAGKLQGEELNAVLDNAQPIVQNIADYMGVPVGQIKQLASEGAISAEVIKNAMFAAAEETNEKFNKMPMTFSQVANNIGNAALMAFQPALQQLSAITQTAGFGALQANVMSAIQGMASFAVGALDVMGQAVLWAQDNWGWLIPVIGGVTSALVIYKGAVVAYNVVQGISNALSGAAKISAAAHAAAMAGESAATFLATATQYGLNAALLACPLTWIVMGIVAVVAAIAIWVNHVGGLKVAWLMCVNTVLTAGDKLQLAFSFISMHVQNALGNMEYAFTAVKVGILNALSLMKVGGLAIVESFLNGVIDRINQLIEFVNSIPGVSIDAIGHVELVASAAAGEQAKIKQRASDLAANREETSAAQEARQREYGWQKLQADAARDQREWEIRQAQKAGKNSAEQAATAGNHSIEVAAFDGLSNDIAGNTGNTAANTAAMADSLDILDEDLKYMRDVAEQEIINRFTLAELKIDVNNNNTLKTQTDFADVNRMLGMVTGEILAVAAEGGHL